MMEVEVKKTEDQEIELLNEFRTIVSNYQDDVPPLVTIAILCHLIGYLSEFTHPVISKEILLKMVEENIPHGKSAAKEDISIQKFGGSALQ